jgi:hypothetical protein
MMTPISELKSTLFFRKLSNMSVHKFIFTCSTITTLDCINVTPPDHKRRAVNGCCPTVEQSCEYISVLPPIRRQLGTSEGNFLLFIFTNILISPNIIFLCKPIFYLVITFHLHVYTHPAFFLKII